MTAKPDSACDVAWNLDFLYESPEDPKIREDWAEAHRMADALSMHNAGRVAKLSAGELYEAIRDEEDIHVLATKPLHYAHLRYAADASDPKNGAFLQEQMERSSEISVKTLFFNLEIQAAPQEVADAWLASDELAAYRHHLSVVRVYAPYRLSEIEERLLEETSNVGSRAWVRLHDELLSNFVFPYRAPGSDEEEGLSQEQVITKLRDADREVRRAGASALTRGLNELNRTIVFIYNTLLADKKLEDRLRKFEYPEQSRNLANELDRPTVDLVMRLCRERGEVVARYYRVKKQILGLEQLEHIDRYAPLFPTEATKTWDEAREIVVDSFSKFHPEAGRRAEEFFGGWIDAASRKGKGGGAFCSYITPDTHPVVLLTYLGKLNDVMTLAHELGHGVHASLSREQSYFNFSGSLPLAELASIFGEMLVFERLVGEADARDQVALYADKIEGIFASVFRQAAMFRFEQRAHEIRRNEGELSAERFGELWQEEQQSMFGDSVKLGEDHRLWWSYVGHFFFAPFYVYAYSFGELLTLSLYRMAQGAGPEFAEKYLDVLRLGGSLSPYELAGKLGVDLRSEAFWNGGFDAIEEMVATFEKFWANLPKD